MSSFARGVCHTLAWCSLVSAIFLTNLCGSASAGGKPSAGQIETRLVTAGWSRQVAGRIARHLTSRPARPVAVFDHDGTLMHGDITEGDGKAQVGLLRDLLDQNRLRPEGRAVIPAEHLADPWTYYREWAERDPGQAYAWLPTLLAGYRPGEVERVAWVSYRDYYRRYLYPEMLALLQVLRDVGCEIFLVSASAELLVDAAAEYIGVPRSHILGIRLKIRDGVLLPAVAQPISYCQGKVWYIQQFVRPDFPADLLVFGDSYGNDGPMLRYAARSGGIGVLINPKPGLQETLDQVGVLSQTLPSEATFPGRKD